MARVRLAENYMSLSEGVADLYITIPDGRGGVMKVREDLFDDLDDDSYEAFLDAVEPLNTTPNMNGLFSKWRERRQAKRQERREDKQAHQMDKINARQQGGGVLGKIGDIVGGIFGGKQAPPADTMPMQTKDFSLQVGNDLPPPVGTGSWWDRNKNWVLPVGITAAVVVTAVAVSKKKKRRD